MDQIDQILSDQITLHKTPSIQYILFNKNTILKKYISGFADLKSRKQIDEGTTYHAFSTTKTFTALAVLQLAEQKKLDIHKPIGNYLPDFPYSSDITIRQVLAHSAGIPNPIPISWIHLAPAHSMFDRNIFFKNIFARNKKVRSKPNDKYAYSNLGYVLLGQLIEKITRLSFEKYVGENIITKLGIDSNELGFEIADGSSIATGYQKQMSFTNLILGFFLDKSKFMGKVEGRWKPFNNFYVNGVSYGGLIGRPLAFVKYIQELLKPGNTLISDRYKQLLFQENFANDGKPTGICLSWFKGQIDGITYFCHAGGGGGYYCEIRIYPKNDLGSVIFFNRTGLADERFLDKLDKIHFDFLKSRNTEKTEPSSPENPSNRS